MTRKQFLMLAASAGLRAQTTGRLVNDDHGNRLSGVNAATAHHDAAPVVAAPAAGKVQPVTTRSGGNLRHGAYLSEQRLTPAVVAGGLRKQFSLNLAGDARGTEAQPLFQPAVKLSSGKTRDLCICCTMSNNVHAFDAGSGELLWTRNVGRPVNGGTAIDSHVINDHWGILSTGVLDGGMLYCVAWTSTDGTPAKGRHLLFQVRLTDGAVVRSLAMPAEALARKQRAGLTVSTAGRQRTLFIPWGTIRETADGAHGFITAVDLGAFKVTAEWNATPNGKGGGLWMAGQGLTEEDGNLYFQTGNGTFGNGDFSESFVRLLYQNGAFTVADWWTPWMDSQRPGDWDDMDLGSASPAYIPEFGLLAGAGKDGILYVVDARNMGKTTSDDIRTHAQANYGKLKSPPIWFTFFPGNGVSAAPDNPANLDQHFFGRTHHQHGSAIYWNKKLYCWGENGNLRVFGVDADGAMRFLGRSREVASPFSPAVPNQSFGGMPGGMMCLSANGDRDGVVWACVPDEDANVKVSNGRVFAFDASDFSGTIEDGDHLVKRIWMSDTYVYNKFNVPIVNGGRLYVPTYNGKVDAYGV